MSFNPASGTLVFKAANANAAIFSGSIAHIYSRSLYLGSATGFDCILNRDAANILSLRNSTNQNKLRVTNTWTDASNYEYGALTGVQGASINLTAETAGTGADNLDIVLTPAGTGIVTTPANIYTAGNCSALTFTDRTPDFEGDALAALKPITGKDGEVDHTTLPEFAKSTIKRTVVNSVTENKVEVPIEEAIEEVDVEVPVMQDKIVQTVDMTGKALQEVQKVPIIASTETKYELVNGEVQRVEKPIQQTETQTQKKLKDGVTLNPTDGKFYKTETIVDKQEVEEPGRDLGAMISILTKAVQQLTAENDLLKERIGKLEAR